LGARTGWVLGVKSQSLYPQERDPVSSLLEAGWVSESVWSVLENLTPIAKFFSYEKPKN
jgi:hypothetical protein